MMTQKYSYPVYAKIAADFGDDEGAEFQCVVIENGQSRLVFSGSSKEAAEQSARDWAAQNLDTPERHAKIAAANEARKIAREKAKAKKENAG